MQTFFDYFVSPLVFPIYVGLILYLFGWIAGRFFADIFAKQLAGKPSAVERGTNRAWKLMVILHFIFLSIFVLGLCIHVYPRVPEWPHIFFYVISYVPFLIIDFCLFLSLVSYGTKAKK